MAVDLSSFQLSPQLVQVWSFFFPGMPGVKFWTWGLSFWFNFCQARGISNLGLTAQVVARVLAHPPATLPFLSAKAPVIAHFSPHVLVVNLGLFDLLRVDMDLLSFVDHFWDILAHVTTCMPGMWITKVILLSQLCSPLNLLPDHLYSVWIEAFHSRLLTGWRDPIFSLF